MAIRFKYEKNVSISSLHLFGKLERLLWNLAWLNYDFMRSMFSSLLLKDKKVVITNAGMTKVIGNTLRIHWLIINFMRPLLAYAYLHFLLTCGPYVIMKHVWGLRFCYRTFRHAAGEITSSRGCKSLFVLFWEIF